MHTSAAHHAAAATVHLVDSLVDVRTLELSRIAPPPGWLVAWGDTRALAGRTLIAALKRLWFRRIPPVASVKRLAIFSVGTLGDHLVLLPALVALRRRYSQARLTLLVSTDTRGKGVVADLFQDRRLADDVIYVADPPTKRNGMVVDFDEALGNVSGCDLFVNFSPFGNRGLANAVVRELFVARRIGARSVAGFGLRGWPGGRLQRRLLHTYVKNEPRRAAEVLAELGLAPAEPTAAFPPSSAALAAVQRHLGTAGIAGKFAVVNPGAKLPAQRWPAERFIAVARTLRERGFSVVVAGVGEERALGDLIVGGLASRAVNLAGKTTLPELVELIRLSVLCVTNDTGTMHLAAQLAIPTAALFTTRQSPAHWFPDGTRVTALMSFTADSYDYRDGPDAHASLLAIKPDDVTRAIEHLQRLGRIPGAAGGREVSR